MSRVVRAGFGLCLIAAAVVIAAGVYSARKADRIDQAGVVLVVLTCAALGGAGATTLRRSFAVPRALPGSRAGAAGPPPLDAAVLLQGVSVSIGSRQILDGVDLHVSRGEIVGLLGPNGAGKTTTVDVCCGLRAFDAGSAQVLGVDTARGGIALRRAIGVVPQDTGLYPELTAVEHLELFAALYDVPGSRARIAELLELLGLTDRKHSRVGTYSGGMKRRLGLARALLHDPPVLFLDEPTLGVDVHGRRALWDHVRRLRAEGRAVLLATNYLEEATALCDRVVIIDHGRIVADASPDALRRTGGSVLRLTVDGDAVAVAAALAERLGVPTVADGVDVVQVALAREELAAGVVRAATDLAGVRELRTEQASLDDVFLRLTGRELAG